MRLILHSVLLLLGCAAAPGQIALTDVPETRLKQRIAEELAGLGEWCAERGLNEPGRELREEILFVDPPGLHSSEKALNIALNAQVHEAADDCDVALLLVEDEWGDEQAQLAARMRKRGATVLAVGTKADLGPAPDGWRGAPRSHRARHGI